MAVVTDPRLGAELAGYRVERLIGRGGMSVVYLAADLRLGRKVALKLLAPELAADEQFRERFLHESRIAASLDHSRVVPVYEAGESNGQLFIAMRYVEGTSLKALLRRDGVLPVERAVDIAAQVASALDHAHARGLVHQDVKPANVLVAEEGSDAAYLADFGITRPVAAETAPTNAGGPVGTADYMAPEQIERGPVDGRADVYALGCLLFECLTGRPPFQSDSLMALLWAHVNEPPPRVSSVAPGLPAALDAVIAGALAKSPDDRYPSCEAFVADAKAVLGGRTPFRLRRRQWARRARSRTAVAAAAALLVASGLVSFLLVTRGEVAAGPTATPTTNSLQLIDPRTNRLVASAPADTPLTNLAAGDGDVWALAPERRRFLRIGRDSGAVVGAGSTLGDPASIASGLNGVWIAKRTGATASTATLLKIDPAAPEVANAFSLPTVQRTPREDTLGDMAVSELPESRGVWLASPAGLSVLRVRGSGTVAATIRTGPSPPRLLAVVPGGVWVTHPWGLVRIDPAANRVAARIPLPFTPRGIAADARGVWLSNGIDDTVWHLDGTTGRFLRRIRVGREPSGIALALGSVWIANRLDGTVTRVDTSAGRVVATIPVGGKPEQVLARTNGIWAATHALPSRTLTEAEYRAEFRRLHLRAWRLLKDADEPLLIALQSSRSRQLELVASLDPAIGREFRILDDRLAAELRALDVPERFAPDHERYLEGLARLSRLDAQLEDALARRDYRRVLQTPDAWSNGWLPIRAGMSDEFKSLFRGLEPYFQG